VGRRRRRECGLDSPDPRQRRRQGTNAYELCINQNHPCPVQFTTLAHELAHLYLAYVSAEPKRHIPSRRLLKYAERELEAESVAYLISLRNGITPKSQTYLSAFVSSGKTTDDIDLYQVMRAAGQIEAALGLGRPTRFAKSRHP
jgi:antirestriction protein ArdC